MALGQDCKHVHSVLQSHVFFLHSSPDDKFLGSLIFSVLITESSDNYTKFGQNAMAVM